MGQTMNQIIFDTSELVDWFGEVPNFHDCEIEKIEAIAKYDSLTISVRSFIYIDDVSADGEIIKQRHSLVIFKATGLLKMEISNWYCPNVIGDLSIKVFDHGVAIDIEPAVGMSVSVFARSLSASVVQT
jgi:Immunity protein 50